MKRTFKHVSDYFPPLHKQHSKKQRMRGDTHIDTIHDELFTFEISRWLTTETILLTFALVCKRWAVLSETMVTEVFEYNQVEIESLERFTRLRTCCCLSNNTPLSTSVFNELEEIGGPLSPWLFTMLSRNPTISRVYISYCSPLHLVSLDNFTEQYPGVRQLKIEDANMDAMDIFKHFPSVESMEMNYANAMEKFDCPPTLTRLSLWTSKIKQFPISNNITFIETDFVNVALLALQQCKHLDTLKIKGYQYDTRSMVKTNRISRGALHLILDKCNIIVECVPSVSKATIVSAFVVSKQSLHFKHLVLDNTCASSISWEKGGDIEVLEIWHPMVCWKWSMGHFKQLHTVIWHKTPPAIVETMKPFFSRNVKHVIKLTNCLSMQNALHCQ
jgi:hypothetical protein